MVASRALQVIASRVIGYDKIDIGAARSDMVCGQ